jgi:hypothetical protein
MMLLSILTSLLISTSIIILATFIILSLSTSPCWKWISFGVIQPSYSEPFYKTSITRSCTCDDVILIRSQLYESVRNNT